jgi:putative membrane protein
MAAALWIVTGLLRAFAGYEKGADYYLHNKLFLAKLILLAVVLALELQPMAGLIGWRRAIAHRAEPDTTRAMRWHRISQAQAILIVLMVIAATGMARGFGAPGR